MRDCRHAVVSYLYVGFRKRLNCTGELGTQTVETYLERCLNFNCDSQRDWLKPRYLEFDLRLVRYSLTKEPRCNEKGRVLSGGGRAPPCHIAINPQRALIRHHRFIIIRKPHYSFPRDCTPRSSIRPTSPQTQDSRCNVDPCDEGSSSLW
jgi:hypothetical protein